MNKEQLQQELLKRVKPGIKPSDLKKGQNSQTSQPIPTPPPTPPLKPSKSEVLPSPSSLNLELATNRDKSLNKNQAKTLSKSFHCPACRITKKETPALIKVAITDPEYNLIKGQTYPFCSICSPKIKEFNSYDLITPELWDKYPYSDAKEILELEFGIKEEKTW